MLLETLLVLLVFMTSNKLLKVTIKVNFFVVESLRLLRVREDGQPIDHFCEFV